MSERIVTTIGGIFDHAQANRATHSQGRTPARPPPRRRTRGKLFDDGINGMMGIEEDPIPDGGILVPILQPPVGPALAIPEPEAPPSKSGSPAAATPRKAAWARGDGSYVLQNGDTLWGLATTYLASGPRWPEIWNAQSAAYRASRTPDKIFAGDVIAMTSEAQAKARALGLFGIGASVVGRGFSVKQVAAAAAGVVGLGSLVYFASR